MTAAVLDYRVPTLLDATVISRVMTRPAADPYATPYVLPEAAAQEPPDVTRKLHELIRWAGWSNRILAQIMGVTHPTVAQVLAGRVGALSRRGDAVRRLDDAYNVASRIYLLAGRDERRSQEAMDTAGSDGMTALDYLIEEKVPQAYMTAVRVLRPQRVGGMMVGSHPIDPRRASTAVYDED